MAKLSASGKAFCSCNAVAHCGKWNRLGKNIGLALAIVAGAIMSERARQEWTVSP